MSASGTSTPGSTESPTAKFYLEEHKILSGVVFDLDKRVPQTFGVSMTAYISLLTWIAKIVLESDQATVIYAYGMLVPNLLLAAAFHYLVAQRRDLVGYAAYLALLEHRLGVCGIQTGMGFGPESVRSEKKRRGESHDTIPLFFWALFSLSVVLFWHALEKVHSNSAIHLYAILIFVVLFLAYTLQWARVMPEDYPAIKKRWFDAEAARVAALKERRASPPSGGASSPTPEA